MAVTERHGQRPRHLPRRLHLHARRLGLRLCLQQPTTSAPSPSIAPITFLAPARLGDRLTASAARGRSAAGRIGHLRHRGDRARTASVVAEFRGHSRTVKGPPAGVDRRRSSTSMRGTSSLRPSPTSSSRSRPPRATRSRRCSSSACKWSLRHAYENVPHYRTKFDAAGVHPDDLQTPRRPRASSRSPTRTTCARTIRSACSPCRASRSCASTPPRARPASRPSSATRKRDIDIWADLHGALDPRRRRPAGRHRARRLRLRPVHRRPRRALRRRAARLHRDPDVRRHDRAAGASSSATSSPTSSW